MKEKFPLSMVDVIPLLGLPTPPRGKSNYYVKCPCCDTNGKHLNINFVKNAFRCPRCGVSGGVLDLYATFTGVPRGKAFKAVAEGLHLDIAHTTVRDVVHQASRMSVLTDVVTRDKTYNALLSKLTLADDHCTNLLGRGLTQEDIVQCVYRTTPVLGFRTIARQLLSEGHCLAGVPGFYRDKEGEWCFVHQKRGILIPVRDPDGYIQGLQLRLDDSQRFTHKDNRKGRKFRWVATSDAKFIDGCGAEAWIHVAGDLSTAGDSVLLIEGPMKGEIVHRLTGQTVIAVPGVNSLGKLVELLPRLEAMGIRHVMTAFDMDYLTNHHVQAGLLALYTLLDEAGMTYGTYLWNPAYNGLDDYIWSQLQIEEST